MSVDWDAVFVPQTPVLEILARGTVMYLALFVLLRLVLKRESSGMGVTDLLVVVLIAEAAQNGMAGEYRSVPDGLILVAVILLWAYAVDWLGYHVKSFERLVQPSALLLVKDGEPLRRNMRRELITEDELMSQVRLHGLERLEDVHRAYMEGDGRISVVPAPAETAARAPRRGG